MTNTKQTVLTDDECISILKLGQGSVPAARAIESAVLSKLRAAGEPSDEAVKMHMSLVGKLAVATGAYGAAESNSKAEADINSIAEKLYDEVEASARALLFRYAAPQAGATDLADAYEGAREDMAIWKRRALEAENLLRIERATSCRLVAELNATNGPIRMGEPAPQASTEVVRQGWKLVPVEPTESMVIAGFESAPDQHFSLREEWDQYQAMTGCQQAAHRARLCWAAMLAAAPAAEDCAKGAGDVALVEAVTKAILFADCGNTEDWQDNTDLGEAAIRAMANHFPATVDAEAWAELHTLRAERGPADGEYATWKDAAIAERMRRVELERQQRGADENDREAWAADMIAAGAQHLGGDDWEWDVEDFQFRLWQQAMRRQQRGGDVGEHGAFRWRKGLRAALAAQPAALMDAGQPGSDGPWPGYSASHAQPAASAEPVAWHVNDKALGKTYVTQSATAAGTAIQDGGSARPLVYSDSALAAHKPDGGDAKSPRQEYDRGFNDGWDAGHKHGRDLGFNAGVCVSLSHVRAQDCSVTWGEIVRACGKDELFYYAAHVEPEEWKLAGFNHYAKAVFGEGKPRKRAAISAQQRQGEGGE